MTDGWRPVAKRKDGATRVERKGDAYEYRLVTEDATWTLDEIEGLWWEATAQKLNPEMVDYHLGNLALAHSLCVRPGSSFGELLSGDA